MNYAIVRSSNWCRRLLCTCGREETEYRRGNCPKCNAPAFKQEKKFQNFIRFTNKTSNVNEDTAYFKNDIIDIAYDNLSKSKIQNFKERNIYEVNIDFKKHTTEIKLNGNVIENSLINCKRAVNGIDMYECGDFLHDIAIMLDERTLSGAIYYFAQYPQIEVFYSTYKSVRLLSGITPMKGTKPYEIMGLSKAAYKIYYEFCNKYLFWRLPYNKYIEQFRQLDKFYEGKPDCFRQVINFLERINTNNIPGLCNLIIKHGYMLDRLKQYLTDDIYTYQGIGSPEEGLNILIDYVNVCDMMEVEIEKYPKSLKLAHDIAAKNLKIVVSEKENEEFCKIISEKDYKELKYNDKDYIVAIPNNAEDVITEGKKLHHCVGSYIKKIRDGETKICFMRDKKTPDIPLITLEVRDGHVTQYRGNCNRMPNQKEMDFIKKYAEAKRIPIK